MEKVERGIKNNFTALTSLVLGFDDIAREKASKQLERCSPINALSIQENELLMFLLSQGIMS